MKVRCAGGCARPLDWTATSQAHADNLLAKHDREYHQSADPAEVDLSAAAAAVLRADRGAERGGALMVWAALTRMPQEAALAYARQVADQPTRAIVAPF